MVQRPGKRVNCILVLPRFEPHRDRKVSAADALEAKPSRGIISSRECDTFVSRFLASNYKQPSRPVSRIFLAILPHGTPSFGALDLYGFERLCGWRLYEVRQGEGFLHTGVRLRQTWGPFRDDFRTFERSAAETLRHPVRP